MTVKEYIKECKDEGEIPIIIELKNNIYFYTKSDIKRSINAGELYYECKKILSKDSRNHWNNNRNAWNENLVIETKEYVLLTDFAILQGEGMIDYESFREILRTKKMVHVKLVKNRTVKSFIVKDKYKYQKGPNCLKPLSDVHIYDLNVIKL